MKLVNEIYGVAVLCDGEVIPLPEAQDSLACQVEPEELVSLNAGDLDDDDCNWYVTYTDGTDETVTTVERAQEIMEHDLISR